MRTILELFSILIVLLLLTNKCANPSNPTGGPKDTIPPSLIETIPVNEKINFSSSTIELVFDEYVNADKLKSELVITPNYEGKYSHIVKKNRVIIEFDDSFDENTTYNLNFASGITDITERNPAVNLIYVFSTGDYLDSLKVSGLAQDLLSKEPLKDITIALYQFSDTLDPTKYKPRYFIKTDEDGVYNLHYLKDDTYKIYAFKDENQSLTIETKNEQYGFKSDTIQLIQNLDSIYINLVSINASPFNLISARPFGKYFDVRFSKPVKNITIQPLVNDSIYYLLTNEQQNIRIFNHLNLPETDSIGFFLMATDTLEQTITDTLFAKFNDGRSKQEEFKVSLSSKRNNKVTNNLTTTVNFTKPVVSYNIDSIYIQLDTLVQLYTQVEDLKWNANQTSLTFLQPVDWSHFTDTLKKTKELLLDTSYTEFTPVTKFQLYLPEASFISVETDTSSVLKKVAEKYDPSKYGLINLKAQTNKASYIIQLVDKKLNVIEEIKNQSNYTFTGLDLGTYSFRVLIDENNDGIWNPGNILLNQEPEPVILYETFTDVRPNFEISIEDLTF